MTCFTWRKRINKMTQGGVHKICFLGKTESKLAGVKILFGSGGNSFG